MAEISVENVSKRYRIGSRRASLREAIPNLFRRRGLKGPQTPEEQVIWALRDVSLLVQSGETLGIIGRNGAGKTTVLKLLSKITQPTSGTIRMSGRTSALIELGAGFHPDLTGRDNIYLNASILGLGRREIARRFDEIVAFSELESFMDMPVKRYSSGMYARLGFSVAAHVDPDILLVDEVLSVGDLGFQQKCMAKIKEFQSVGKCIVFISHNMDAIQRTCSRAVWLNKGQIAFEGDPQDVVSKYAYSQIEQSRRTLSSVPEELTANYGSGEVQIERVKILDGTGQERDPHH